MGDKAKITKQNDKIIISNQEPLKVRGSWGNVKPYTRIHQDRTKYNRKDKHKKDLKTENYDDTDEI